MTQYNYMKVNEELGVVFGFGMVSTVNGEPFVDSQNDFIPEGAMLKASFKFMSGDRPAKKMHAGSAIGSVVYGFPLTAEIAKSLGIDTMRTGFLVGVKFDDQAILQKFKSGEFTGFSIGGRRVRDVPISETQMMKGSTMQDSRTITKAQAESELDFLAKSYATQRGVNEATAMSEVLKTPRGQKLYTQYVNSQE